MKLEVNGKVVAEQASAEDIKAAMRELDPSAEAFIVVSEREGVFLQAAGVPTDGFVMGFQNAETGEELTSKNQALKQAAVTRALVAYAQDNWDWRTTIGWLPSGAYAAKSANWGAALRRAWPVYAAIIFFAVAIVPLVMGTKWLSDQAVFKGLCEQHGDGIFHHYEHGGGDDITVSYSPPRCWFEDGKNVDFHTIVGSNAGVIDSLARAAEVLVPVLLILVIEGVGLGLWWRGRRAHQ